MKYADFEKGNNDLIFGDKTKVELKSFRPEGKDKDIRFFRKKDHNQGSEEAKIISRSGFASLREPFEVEPGNQILIDEANKYGTLVDENKENALRGIIKDSEVMKETKMSVAKIVRENLIWVARGQMVCHPDSLIYGEVDEIGYSKEEDTYYVGDTKTASQVDKMTYGYQLAIYIGILRKLNPGKKISSIAIIDGVKIKTQKGVYNKNFDESKGKEGIGKEVKPTDEVYRSRGDKKVDISPIEETNLLIKRDIEKMNLLDHIEKEFSLIKKYNITSPKVFNEILNSKETFKKENDVLQKNYDLIGKKIKDA